MLLDRPRRPGGVREESAVSLPQDPQHAALDPSRRARGWRRRLTGGIARHLAADGGAVFVTLTMPHDAGMPLERVWDAVSAAWAALVAGRHRKRLREEFGPIGYVRAVEVTLGQAVRHPHLHVLLLTEAPLDLDDLRELHRFLRERWGRRVVRRVP